jgi:hypothetical protein
LLASNQHLVVDEPARQDVRITLVLVAAYELLRPDLGRDRAIDTAPAPFVAMVDTAKLRETESLGAGFEFHHTADGDRFHADVHRCR